MANTINLYDTTTMLEAIRLFKRPYSFLRDTFFPNIKTFPTEKVLIDIVKGGEKMAPFVAPRINGSIDTRQGYNTNELTAPRIAPKRILTGEDLAKRQPGDNIFTTRSPQEIAASILVQDLTDLDDQITRTEEWFSAQVMLGSAFDIDLVDEKGNKSGGTFNVDYGFENVAEVKTGEKWGTKVDGKITVADIDIISQIEGWVEDYIIKQSTATPDIAVLDPDAGKAFVNNSYVKDLLTLRAQSGFRQEPTYKGQGVTFLGVFTKYNLEFYTYSNFVKTDSDAKQLLPSGTVIVGQSAQGTLAYGAVMQKESGTWMKYLEKRVPRYVVNDEDETDVIKLTSRPLPYQKDVNSYVVATVI
jgi:hypothetical protein